MDTKKKVGGWGISLLNKALKIQRRADVGVSSSEGHWQWVVFSDQKQLVCLKSG